MKTEVPYSLEVIQTIHICTTMYNAAVIFLCAFFAKYSRIAFLSMTKEYYFFLARFNMYFSFEEFYIDIICMKKNQICLMQKIKQ